ncbi:MAG TPA: DNA polymerase/3'-5' exonuclease PolX [Thermoanaerobaculia bacterium]|jgi:DNA polymerase (family 10)
MDRNEVAHVLEEIAAMLELKGENVFKVRAYDSGARAIRGFSGDLARAVRTRELLKVRGIGGGLFSNIETLLTTGSLPYYDELRASFPPGLRECLRIPGFGARKAKLLHEKLGIDSLEALETACREGKVAGLKGFGPKTEEGILRGIEMLRTTVGLHRYSMVKGRAEELAAALAATGLASRVEIAGGLRRRSEVVEGVELVASSDRPGELARSFRDVAGIAEVLAADERRVSLALAERLRADLTVVPDEEFGAALLHATGSREHLTGLAGFAETRGMRLDERGISGGRGGTKPRATRTETEIYRALELPFIEPELREGRGEIEAAARGALPELVEESDVRGLIHVHTTESDGRATLEEMVGAAKAAGYEYAAITDHSQGAAYAGGLTPDRVARQRDAIREAQSRFPGFRIFHGTEADILADGSIDYGDEFLETFDVVVASIHSRFGLPREEQTRRLVRAVENPRVSVLGHPTGRLLLTRKGIDADMEAVLSAAARSGCAVEINGSPHRLDLDWRLVQPGVEKGILFSIGPDAHSVQELGNAANAVGIARKGWVTPAATLNAKSADELAAWLQRRRGSPLSD